MATATTPMAPAVGGRVTKAERLKARKEFHDTKLSTDLNKVDSWELGEPDLDFLFEQKATEEQANMFYKVTHGGDESIISS